MCILKTKKTIQTLSLFFFCLYNDFFLFLVLTHDSVIDHVFDNANNGIRLTDEWSTTDMTTGNVLEL